MVSPILWKGLSGMKRLSAGRVQSPALWLVVEAILALRRYRRQPTVESLDIPVD